VDHLQLTIPAREDSPAVKIRPREVRDWLDDLPYLDPERATRLASQQLRVMNRQTLPAGARLQILGDFLATYQRLSGSLSTMAGDTEHAGQQLKRLCQDIGFGYKIVVHELASARSRLLDGRNLSLGLLGAMQALGMQLMHYYVSHQRAPRALWNECLALYRYAHKYGRHTCSATLPGVGDTRLDGAFRLIALMRHTNPYGLAPGMAPALQHYLGMHAHLAVLEIGAALPAAGPRIVLTDSRPPAAGDPVAALALDVSALAKQLATDIGTLQRHKQARAIGMPAEVPATVLLRTLQQLLKQWQSPHDRYRERQAAHATIELLAGLDAVYCVLNKGRCFDPGLFLAPGHEDVIDLGSQPALEARARQQQPAGITCPTINRSSGGVALSYRGETGAAPRVGQLVAVRRAGSASPHGWVLAVCRWLVHTDRGSGFDIGLQYLARHATAIVIRPNASLAGYDDYQPALLTDQKRGDALLRTLIARSGVVQAGASVTVYDQGKQYSLRCVELVESGTGFERYTCQPPD